MFQNICIILLVNILFYLKTLKFGYVSDDVPSSQRPKLNEKWLHWLWVLEGKLKSYPQADHAITTLIHALVCVGIYIGFGANDVSFIASLLFSFNPINNQGSVWISGRGYALSALGMVWALALPVLSPVALLLATYSNAGFLMPLALIGSPHPYLLALMPFIWMFHVKRFRANVFQKMNMEVFVEDRQIHPKKLILATKTFGYYTLLSILPIRTTFYHSLLESIAGSKAKNAYTYCRYFWVGVISIGLILAYVLTHKWDMVCFGLLWWCIGIAPFINLYRMQQELAERFCYVPNIGLMFVLSSFISSSGILSGAFIACYATKMWFYMNAYRDDFWLIETAVLNCPESWFAWHIRALKRWDVGSHKEALNFWVMAKMLSPKEFKILYNISAALMLCGNKKESLEFLAQAEKNIPRGQEEQVNKIIGDFKKGTVTILI